VTTKYWTPYDKFVYQVNLFQFFHPFSQKKTIIGHFLTFIYKLVGTNIHISVVKWQLALESPNQFLNLKMVPKMAILHPIKHQITKILMENTI
jgi:hypothetical protein